MCNLIGNTICCFYLQLALSGQIEGSKISILSFGLNWWFTQKFGVNINYRNIIFYRYALYSISDGIMGRVILELE